MAVAWVEEPPQPRAEGAAQPARHVVLVGNTGWNIVHFRRDLIAALVRAGWRVSAIAAFDRKQLEQLTALGAEGIALEIDAAGRNPLDDLAYLFQLTRRLRRLRPDLIHLFTLKPVIYGALAAKLARVPGIVTSITGAGMLGGGSRPWLRRLLRGLMRAALSGRPLVVFQNPDDRAWFLAHGIVPESRAFLIAGSGVDTEALRPPATPSARRTSFVMASRMLKSKGVADFVAAARIVGRRHPDARFELFGGTSQDYGSKNPDFVERAWLEQVDREGVVTWHGWTAPAEVEAAMRRAAAVVLPSTYAEGVPRCLIEAAALGAPIITTDHPGCRDAVIDGETGTLVPPHAPEALAAAMAALLAEPARIAAMGEAGRRLACERFDQRLVNDATTTIYCRALGSHPGPGDAALRPA